MKCKPRFDKCFTMLFYLFTKKWTGSYGRYAHYGIRFLQKNTTIWVREKHFFSKDNSPDLKTNCSKKSKTNGIDISIMCSGAQNRGESNPLTQFWLKQKVKRKIRTGPVLVFLKKRRFVCYFCSPRELAGDPLRQIRLSWAILAAGALPAVGTYINIYIYICIYYIYINIYIYIH